MSAPDRYGDNAPPLIPLDTPRTAAEGGPSPSSSSTRPKGILKNATPSQSSGAVPQVGDFSGESGEEKNGLTWDEENLARTEAEKDSQMKITEPKTPYVQYDALTDMVLSEVPGFDLGTLNGQDAPSPTTGEFALPPGRSNGSSPHSFSRSTSFSLPASEHPASSLVAPSPPTMTVAAGEIEEEELTPEQEAKHQEFVKARGRHYSNEGEAMRKSKELLEKELEEEEEEEGEEEEGEMDGVEETGETNGLRLNGM